MVQSPSDTGMPAFSDTGMPASFVSGNGSREEEEIVDKRAPELWTEKDKTQRKGLWNFQYHPSQVIGQLDFLGSKSCRPIAKTVEENLEFDFSDEEEDLARVQTRCFSHSQVFNLPDESDLSGDCFFLSMVPTLYPGDDPIKRARELRFQFYWPIEKLVFFKLVFENCFCFFLQMEEKVENLFFELLTYFFFKRTLVIEWIISNGEFAFPRTRESDEVVGIF